MPVRRSRGRYALGGVPAILAAAVLWGTTGTASSFRPDTASALSVGAARIVLGSVVLLVWAGGHRQVQPVLRATTGRRLLVLGAAGVAVYQLCFFVAVARTGVAVGTVVAIGCAPLFTGLLARATGGTPLTRRWMLATAVAVTGCTVLVLGGAPAGVEPLGVLLALLAGLAYASFSIAAAALIGTGLPSGGVLAVLFGGAGLVLLPVLLATAPGWLLTVRGALVTVHLAVLTAAVAYLLFGRGLRTVPVATAATLSLAEPGTAALLGLLLLGEPARPPTVVGLGLLFTALLVLTLRPPSRAEVHRSRGARAAP